MNFISTNGQIAPVTAKQAILKGLAPDGGLFMPSVLPNFTEAFLDGLSEMSLQEIAYHLAMLFFRDDFSDAEMKSLCDDAFNFPCPLVALEQNTQQDPQQSRQNHLYVLELFGGPTLAFKDFGARFMARIVSHYLKSSALKSSASNVIDRMAIDTSQATVLVATSGDTGSAVAHGFFAVPGTKVVLLYPENLVSPLQEKQFATLGGNITSLCVAGTFDDCQSLVKQAFLDKDLQNSMTLLSANSINFARLLPQAVYYLYTARLLAEIHGKNCKASSLPIRFSVPSGNFGNLTAGLLCVKLGMRNFSFVASVNSNDTFPRYMETGVYAPRPSISTISNAMDVGNPSNFARIQHLYRDNLSLLKNTVSSYSFSDEQTRSAIKSVYADYNYIIDPHTAVGYLGTMRCRDSDASKKLTDVILSTAHPAKFKGIVDDVLKIDIALPDSLALCQGKENLSIKINNDYNELRKKLQDSQQNSQDV